MSSLLDLEHPIAALASPPGPAARGIIRLSGAEIVSVLEECFESAAPWRGSCVAGRWSGRMMLQQTSVRPPCDLWYWPGRRSYTGQPMAEFHLPGASPLLEKVLTDLYGRGARPARPGEFTLRAFLNGKIDLVQAEAVMGVVDAHDDVELRTALEQLAGGISGRLVSLRQDLIELLADLEAGLDFVEEDIEFVTRAAVSARIQESLDFVDQLRNQAQSRMTSSVRPKIVLAGLPNAGKSSLFNALTGKPLALVSSHIGTTRDYLQAELDEHGVSFELIDTAGWEETRPGIAAAAQSQRADQFQRADLILWCTPRDQDEQTRAVDESAFEAACSSKVPLLRIGTKSDLSADQPGERLLVSASTGAGLDELRRTLEAALSTSSTRQRFWLGMTAARCNESLQRAHEALARAADAARCKSPGDELIAVDLRDALDHLGAIVGAVYTDDLLDRIFSKFCIGK